MENKQNTIPNANLNGQEKRNVPTLRFPEFDKKWDYKQVKNILNICHGKDYKHLGKGEFPVLGTGGVITYVDNYICNWSCVLIGRKGTINKPQFMISPFWSVDTLFYSKPHNGQLPQFQYYLFQTINWEKYNEGSSVPSLSASTIENIQVHIPSTQEQQKISEFLSLIDQRIETQNKIIKRKKSLITSFVIEFLLGVLSLVESIISLNIFSLINNLLKLLWTIFKEVKRLWSKKKP